MITTIHNTCNYPLIWNSNKFVIHNESQSVDRFSVAELSRRNILYVLSIYQNIKDLNFTGCTTVHLLRCNIYSLEVHVLQCLNQGHRLEKYWFAIPSGGTGKRFGDTTHTLFAKIGQNLCSITPSRRHIGLNHSNISFCTFCPKEGKPIQC